jgi:predicted Zn-dependent protease
MHCLSIRSSGLHDKFIVIFAISFLFFHNHVFASDVIFTDQMRNFNPNFNNDDVLVEYPDYNLGHASGKPDPMAAKIEKLIYSGQCKPSEFPYEKIKDVNHHPYFPKIQKNAIHGDHLGVRFYREKGGTRDFIIRHWANENLPIVFHLTKPAVKYKKWIKEVFDNLNNVLRKHGVITYDSSVIELSDQVLEIQDENCDNHLIFLAQYDGNSLMATYVKTINNVDVRLGEIVDTDIMIYEQFGKRKYKKYFKRGFQRDLTHEFLHALGLDHNFALDSVMSYSNKKIATTNLADDITQYEIDTLDYILNQRISGTPWALIRTFTGIDTGVNYIPTGQYKIRLDEQVLCRNIKTSTSQQVPLHMTMDLKYVNKPYGDDIRLTFAHSANESSLLPQDFFGTFIYFEKHPIDGNLINEFRSDSPKFRFSLSYPYTLDNQFSANIDTGFMTLEPIIPNRIRTKWDVLDPAGEVTETCSIDSAFQFTEFNSNNPDPEKVVQN